MATASLLVPKYRFSVLADIHFHLRYDNKYSWFTKLNSNSPFFEAVMISTSGQQGISFTTHGQKIK
ncbi:MAG: DUF3124 domain-containing protein [Bacteroidetes bacterium]|nr:DUF3124 domain-containing protein [Bacteroidota bacterium]NCQ11035.1 DUF3124 domain-containing protein [Bacteroidota bacterium]